MSLEAIGVMPRSDGSRWTSVLRALDVRVLGPAIVLATLGLVSLASDRPMYAVAQAKWIVVGMALMTAVVLIPNRRLLSLIYPAYALSLVLLVLVLIPGFGRTSHSATRWLQLGPIGFQPSEMAKVAVVAVLARYIRFRRDQRTFRGLAVPFLMTLVPLALIVKQPDLGTGLMLVPVLFATLWAAGARTRHLLTVVLLGVASLPLLYFALAPYQQKRIHTFLVPVIALAEDVRDRIAPGDEAPPDGDAAAAEPATLPPALRFEGGTDDYHVSQSLAAVAGGGVTGQGWRQGRQNEMDLVPESWTDFIFAVHAEEWGFLGVAALLLAEFALLLGLAVVARDVKEPAGRLMAIGAMVLLGTQACQNLAMTVGLAPITGLPLPFLSYGGSSMLSSWLLIGLALNARAHRPLVFASNDFD